MSKKSKFIKNIFKYSFFIGLIIMLISVLIHSYYMNSYKVTRSTDGNQTKYYVLKQSVAEEYDEKKRYIYVSFLLQTPWSFDHYFSKDWERWVSIYLVFEEDELTDAFSTSMMNVFSSQDEISILLMDKAEFEIDKNVLKNIYFVFKNSEEEWKYNLKKISFKKLQDFPVKEAYLKEKTMQ